MRAVTKIKNWVLLRYRTVKMTADLREEGFITVGKRAFAGQKGIETVFLPSSTSAIKTEAFHGCRKLSRVVLAKNTAVGLGDSAFAGCEALVAVENSESLSRIGARAFRGCTSLSAIELGAELRSIGEHAFERCGSLTEITLPERVGLLGRAVFARCTALAKADLFETRAPLAAELFRGCSNLTDVTLPRNLRELPRAIFRDCTALREVILPLETQRIGARAFYGCTALETVTLGTSLTKIGAFAFAESGIRELTLPRSIKRFGFGAFGLGKSEEKIQLGVESEYLLRRVRRMLKLCGSSGRAEVVLLGKTIEERKRERRRADIEQKPVHLFDDFHKNS